MGTLFISFIQSPLNNNKRKSIFPFRLQKASLIAYNSYVMEEVRAWGFNTDTPNEEETVTGANKSITNSMTRCFKLFKKALLLLSPDSLLEEFDLFRKHILLSQNRVFNPRWWSGELRDVPLIAHELVCEQTNCVWEREREQRVLSWL